ncbi:MAG: HAMP domain-containing histidine kinase, partial [Deltaproteobacteria bacterium]|nr:HAMP domain-containing histidine kinase [Deltaproteobacteria bacterium]
KKLYIASIIAFLVIIAYLHYAIDHENPLHAVYSEIRYAPVVIGALAFGLKGAAFMSASIALIYFPFLMDIWKGSWLFLTERGIHIFFPALFGLLIGFLRDVEKKRAGELGKIRYLASLGQAGAALVHDLRSPIVTIRGFANRIEQGKDDPQLSAKMINEAAQRIEQVVESVLSFAKPITLDLREEDVNRFIKELCDKTKTHAEEHEVEVVADVPETEIRAPIDRSFMQRALLNLVTNAIEASRPSQDVVISLGIIKNRVIITIKDKGEGMDRETLENLFIPFYSRKTKGTGLGMIIAKKIIEEHGGRIEVASERGNGTTISVDLPIRQEGIR